MGDHEQYLRGQVVTSSGVLPDAVVEIREGRIAEVRPAGGRDAPPTLSGTIVPGFVDLHCHGGGGASFSSADPEEVDAAARHHLARGTTSLLAAMVTDEPTRLLEAVDVAADAADRGVLAGIYLEGPFLSEGRCGAQDRSLLRDPDVALARELVQAGRGHVRVMALAPELPGASELVDLLLEEGVVPAVGHTVCSAAQAERTFLAGHTAGTGSLATHLFNGMAPLHHRDPGPVAAALGTAAQGQARVELIVDGVHLADATVQMVMRVLPPGAVVLVSDAMAAAGMPDGTYRLGAQDVDVDQGVARLVIDQEVVSIAGSTIHVADALRRCVTQLNIDLRDAAAAASTSPARALGMEGEFGTISPGFRADLVVLDDDARVKQVMTQGRWVA